MVFEEEMRRIVCEIIMSGRSLADAILFVTGERACGHTSDEVFRKLTGEEWVEVSKEALSE